MFMVCIVIVSSFAAFVHWLIHHQKKFEVLLYVMKDFINCMRIIAIA